MKHSVGIFFGGLFLNLCYGLPTSDPKSAPRFALVGERSLNGVPTVSVTFPNGHEDTLILDRHYSSEEDRIGQIEACNYIGYLEKDPEACVAMTGCVGSEDVEFTILSEHATESPMFKWTKEDTVKIIKHPYLHASKNDRMSRNKTSNDALIDEDINAKFVVAEEFCSGKYGAFCILPTSMELQIRVGYDKRFKQKTGSFDAAEKYIKNMLVHVQAYYCHSSLGTRIKVKLLEMPYYHSKEILATDASIESMESTTKIDLGSADLMVYMGYKGKKDSSLGIGNVGVVCEPKKMNKNHKKHSLNMWAEEITYAAQTVAHEVGHNLGMEHDFAPNHGGTGHENQGASLTDCDGTGLMSYDPAPNKWSSCSKKDLTTQYKAIGKDDWCLTPDGCTDNHSICPKYAAKKRYGITGWYCIDGNSSFMKKNCKKTCQFCDDFVNVCKGQGQNGCEQTGGEEKWKGDNQCDDINNTEACGWDGGDCCDNSAANWDDNCFLCQCVDPSKTFSHNGHGV